jgi:hypothetical protein
MLLATIWWRGLMEDLGSEKDPHRTWERQCLHLATFSATQTAPLITSNLNDKKFFLKWLSLEESWESMHMDIDSCLHVCHQIIKLIYHEIVTSSTWSIYPTMFNTQSSKSLRHRKCGRYEQKAKHEYYINCRRCLSIWTKLINSYFLLADCPTEFSFISTALP